MLTSRQGARQSTRATAQMLSVRQRDDVALIVRFAALAAAPGPRPARTMLKVSCLERRAEVVTEGDYGTRQHARRREKHVSFQRLAVVRGSSPVLGPPVLTQIGHRAPLDASFPLDDDYTIVAELELRPHGHRRLTAESWPVIVD
jgi:hypothetical protein